MGISNPQATVPTKAHTQVEGGGGNTQARALVTFQENHEISQERSVVANLVSGFKEKRDRGWMTEWEREKIDRK